MTSRPHPAPAVPASFRRVAAPAVVALSGACDLAAAPAASRRLRAALDRGPATLVVDLSTAHDIDAPLASVLLRAHRLGQEQGTRLVVVPGNAENRAALADCELDDVLELAASAAEIVEAAAA